MYITALLKFSITSFPFFPLPTFLITLETDDNYVLLKEFLPRKELLLKITVFLVLYLLEKYTIMKKLLFLVLIFLSVNSFAQRGKFRNLIEKNDKIGIGTKTPDALLTVKGQIHTQEVQVDLEGAVAPDYVFEYYFEGISTLQPDYQFPELKDVGAYIEENYHLPGIPSAAKLESEGMLLKEMNLLLLQKIEELTIYTLEQQKEIDVLKEKISTLDD